MDRETVRHYLLLTAVTKFGISFISAVYVTFLISRGLNLFEVNLVNFVFFTTLFLCEIPTGAVADVFGRKVSFVCSCFLYGIGMFVYAFSNSFWGFALAEMIAAIGNTFASGAFQAWLVDNLRHHGYSGSLSGVFSKEQQITHGAGIVGAIVGAFLADKNMAMPWIGGGSVMILAGMLAQKWMKEEYFAKQKFSFVGGVKSIKQTIRVSVDYGIRNKIIRFILIIGTVQFFAVQAPNMQWQPFFSQFLDSKTSLGFLWAGMAIAMMFGSYISPWFLEKIQKEDLAIVLCQIGIGVGICLTVFFGFLPALGIFLAHEVARGVFRPLKDVYLNDNIPSKERATLISFESISHHLGGMIGLLASGAIAEYLSMSAAWIVSGLVLVIITLFLLKNGRGE